MVKLNRVFSAMLVVALVLAMAAALLPVGEAKAVNGYWDVYVNSVTGSDNWTGTQPTGGAPNGPKKTILAAIPVVHEGGTVHVAAGTYIEYIDIYKPMTLEGAGVGSTVIDAGGSFNTVVGIGRPQPSQGVTASISGVTIQNGSQDNAGGIFIYSGHTLSLNDCTVRNNTASAGGGIINLGTLIMYGCTVSGNSAVNLGGGIRNSGTANLTNCTISGNRLTGNDFSGGARVSAI